MRKELIQLPAELAFERVLHGLEKELIEASDEEIVAAAADLGMDVWMKGSAAFLGVMHSRPRRLEDIFDVESLRQVYGRLTTDRDGDGD